MNETQYVEINQSTWNRARHYALYENAAYPYVSFTTMLDMDNFRQRCKRRGISFFSGFLYAAMRSLNSIKNFRYRILDGKVVLYDRIDPNYTVFDPEDELFYFADAAYSENPGIFTERVAEATRIAMKSKSLFGGRLDVAHVSCTPWFGFTDVIQPYPIEAGFSIPKIMWGKFETVGGKTAIPFSVGGHHGLFDAFHIAKLFRTMTEIFQSF